MAKTYLRKFSAYTLCEATEAQEHYKDYRFVNSDDAAYVAALDWLNDAITNGMDAPLASRIERVNAVQVLLYVEHMDGYKETVAITVKEAG